MYSRNYKPRTNVFQNATQSALNCLFIQHINNTLLVDLPSNVVKSSHGASSCSVPDLYPHSSTEIVFVRLWAQYMLFVWADFSLNFVVRNISCLLINKDSAVFR